MALLKRLLLRLLIGKPRPIVCPPTQKIHRARQYRSADVAADLYESVGGLVLR